MNTLTRAREGLRRTRRELAMRLDGLRKSLITLIRRVDPRDIAVFGGLALVANGVRQVYAPASWIFVGLFFMWIALRRKPV